VIAQIKGILEAKEPSEIVVDVGGVGYLLLIPLSTFYALPEIGSPVSLKTHTYVRDDAIQIFGFYTASEKGLFKQLITVSKVGPRIALVILSGLDAESLRAAIRNGDIDRLSSIPGVGKKTAARICMELKDKIPEEYEEASRTSSGRFGSLLDQCPYKEAVAALIHLGYRKNEVKEAIRGLATEEENRSVEELIKVSLRLLSKA
jgi:Holliday junction DNA helicase RuvA